MLKFKLGCYTYLGHFSMQLCIWSNLRLVCILSFLSSFSRKLAPINKLLYGIAKAFTSTKNEPNFNKRFCYCSRFFCKYRNNNLMCHSLISTR